MTVDDNFSVLSQRSSSTSIVQPASLSVFRNLHDVTACYTG